MTEQWPPRDILYESEEVLPVPYLDNPPGVIEIDDRAQLFVDDYLIEQTDLKRTFHYPEIHESSPVLKPETELELNNGFCPMAAPFNDGVWYDPADDLYKMWYHAGWFDGTALAYSRDGIEWERPEFDVIPGTNAVINPPKGWKRDGCMVWLDKNADPAERFKMFLYFRKSGEERDGHLYTSSDGIRWDEKGVTSACGDNTTFFYNPFRKKFVFSIRQGWPNRGRAYYEHEDFLKAGQWKDGEQVWWSRSDNLDLPDPLVGDKPQLYDLNCAPYESIMLGAFNIFYGPQNQVCVKTGDVKIIDMQIGYSRDGFHFSRPDRNPFVASKREPGVWNHAYIHAAGGLYIEKDDKLYFYFTGFSGNSPRLKAGESGPFMQSNKMYAGASTGLAILRKDGFASLNGTGELLTKPLMFSGKRLFVNGDFSKGELKTELLDSENNIVEPFSLENSVPAVSDGTKLEIRWKEADLTSISGRPVRIRFSVTGGSLYSFRIV